MLRKLLLTFITLLLLCGCRPTSLQDNDVTHLDILSFKGTPSLCLLGVVNDDVEITITDSNDDIKTAFIDNQKDIIIAPINDGVNYSKEFNNYKLLSIVEYGQMYIASTNEDTNSGVVGAIGEYNVIGYICRYLENTDLHKYQIVWYETLDDLINGLKNGDLNSIIIDEINYNNLNNYQGIELYKIDVFQEDIEYHTRYSSYPVYGMFVKTEQIENNQTAIVNFAKTIKNSISTFKNDKTEFNEVLSDANIEKMGFDNKDLISESYNFCGLDFKYANSEKDSLQNILEICSIELDERIIVE